MRAGVLVLVLAASGCGYAKQANVDAELARLRGEVAAGDRATQEALNARIEQNAQRLAALERELQQLRQDFGARIDRMQGEFEGLIAFDVPVHFDFAKSEIRAADEELLNRFALVVQRYYQGALVTVEGFTDPSGSASYNLKLGQARADAVRAYLIERGLSADQLRAVSYCEAANRQVVAKAARDHAGASANRRVALVIDARSVEPVTAAR